MSENVIKNYCNVCGVVTTMKCTACKEVFYCCVDHQKSDWSKHKEQCRPYAICQSPELGRHVIARRDIPPHGVIFVEAPLVIGPKWCIDENEKDLPFFPCVGCSKIVRIGDNTCPKCNWPACSATCTDLINPNLHGLECVILRTNRGLPIQPFTDHKTFLNFYRKDALFALRSWMLQYRFPAKWAKVIALESHEKDRQGTTYHAEAEQRIVSFLVQNFLNNPIEIERNMGTSILPKDAAETLHRLCGIMDINAFNIESDSNNTKDLYALYEYASILEHSCIPNCYFTFDSQNQYKLTMRAGRNIAKGEHLTNMYTHMLWGTQMRQDHLTTNKCFTCNCERCSDSTELNTFFSALRCLNDISGIACNGIVLLEHPVETDSNWLCNKCDERTDSAQVEVLLSNIEDEIDDILIPNCPSVEKLEELILKFEQLLHPNHFHLFALKYALSQQYGHQENSSLQQLNDDKLNRKMCICNELIAIIDTLDPCGMRLAIYRASILFELYLTILEQGCRLKSTKHILQASDYLEKGKETLKYDTNHFQGRKLLNIFRKAKDELVQKYNDLL